MWNEEKQGGNLRSSFCMNLFRDTVSRCRLHDLGFTGTSFTWSNGRSGKANIRERLDRMLTTPEWMDIFPSRYVRHLPRYKSDHSPIVFDFTDNKEVNSESRRPRRFRLEHMWIQHPGFEKALKDSWNNSYMGNNLMDTL